MKALAVQMLAFADGQCRGQDGAAGVRPGERLALEGTDQRPIGQGGAGDVGPPGLVDDRGFWFSAQLMDQLDHHSAHGWAVPMHAGAEGVEHDDLEVLDQAGRQVGKVGGGDELRPAGVSHAWLSLLCR